MEKYFDEKINEYVYYVSDPEWVVKDVTPFSDFTLLVEFIGGEKKTYDCKPLLDLGVYKDLKDVSFFMKAHVEGDTVAWNDMVDIAPENLWEQGVPIE